MITSIASVTVFVEDQDWAKAFYTEKLGFALINESETFPGADIRWLTVAPPGCPTELTLFPMGGQWEHYREAMGEPQVRHWGCFAMLVDSEGNQIVLGQREKEPVTISVEVRSE